MLTCHIAVRSCCTFVTRALFSATRLSFYKRPNFQTTLTVLNFKGKPITIPDINRSRACTDISISAISFKKLCVGEVKFFSNSTSPLARREGFEPPETLASTVFKTFRMLPESSRIIPNPPRFSAEFSLFFAPSRKFARKLRETCEKQLKSAPLQV